MRLSSKDSFLKSTPPLSGSARTSKKKPETLEFLLSTLAVGRLASMSYKNEMCLKENERSTLNGNVVTHEASFGSVTWTALQKNSSKKKGVRGSKDNN